MSQNKESKTQLNQHKGIKGQKAIPGKKHFTGLCHLSEYDHLIHYEQSDEEHRLVNAVGRRLKQMRTAHSLSRRELARILQIDVELIVMVESGDGPIASAENLLAMVALALPHDTRRDATVD